MTIPVPFEEYGYLWWELTSFIKPSGITGRNRWDLRHRGPSSVLCNSGKFSEGFQTFYSN